MTSENYILLNCQALSGEMGGRSIYVAMVILECMWIHMLSSIYIRIL